MHRKADHRFFRGALLLILAAAAFILTGQAASAAVKNNGALSAQEAKTILGEIMPNVKIIHVVESPIAGLYEIGIDMGGQKAIVYLDHAKKYVISPITRGEIFDVKTRASLTQESFQKINKVDVTKIPLKDALIMGEKTAKHKIIVFSDPD